MNLNTVAALLTQSCQINAEVTGVCTDSREIKQGNVFVAIQGENFDGHEFIKEAEAKGAAANTKFFNVNHRVLKPEPGHATAWIARLPW